MDQPVVQPFPRQNDTVGEPEPDPHLEPLNKIATPNYPQLLDHTLGVVFSCFSNQGAESFQLSSEQLNWATKFIEGHRSEQSPDLKCLANYLRQISIALTAEESLASNSNEVANETDSSSERHESPTESNQICTDLLGTLEQWRSEQLTALDRDFETLLAIEKLLLDWDLEDDM